MKTVSQILHAKGGTEVHIISPDETVLEAIRRMAEHGIGALVVMEGGAIVGRALYEGAFTLDAALVASAGA